MEMKIFLRFGLKAMGRVGLYTRLVRVITKVSYKNLIEMHSLTSVFLVCRWRSYPFARYQLLTLFSADLSVSCWYLVVTFIC